MIDKLMDKNFLTPVVAFTFVPVAVTGILLLFHVRLPVIKEIHDWLGLAFVIFSAFHVAVSWKSLTDCLRHGSAKIALVVAVALTLVCCIIGLTKNSHEHHYYGAMAPYVDRH